MEDDICNRTVRVVHEQQFDTISGNPQPIPKPSFIIPKLNQVNTTYGFGPLPLFRGANNWAAARLHEIKANCSSAGATLSRLTRQAFNRMAFVCAKSDWQLRILQYFLDTCTQVDQSFEDSAYINGYRGRQCKS